MNQNSYVSANSFPVKILQNEWLMRQLVRGYIPPFHAQINLTNKCNFNCGFCSCRERDKTISLNFDELKKTLTKLKSYGCASVTLTGGGETLLYPQIGKVLTTLKDLDIQAGLVTNGSMLGILTADDLDKLVWCRISCSDELPKQTDFEKWLITVNNATQCGKKTDWAFSYVVSASPNMELAKRIINFANAHKFTHVRVVSDILDAEHNAGVVEKLRKILLSWRVDLSRVVFQDRAEFTTGTKCCWLPLLKPVLAATNFWHSCCGAQYVSLKQPSRNYGDNTLLSPYPGAEGLTDFITKQQPFNGAICERCFYEDYNKLLGIFKQRRLEHVKFV